MINKNSNLAFKTHDDNLQSTIYNNTWLEECKKQVNEKSWFKKTEHFKFWISKGKNHFEALWFSIIVYDWNFFLTLFHLDKTGQLVLFSCKFRKKSTLETRKLSRYCSKHIAKMLQGKKQFENFWKVDEKDDDELALKSF